MTAEDKAEIERLAATLRDPSPGKIAVRLQRHPSTVAWYMITRGLIDRTVKYGRPAYRRGGVVVQPYTPEHDRRLLELRVEGRVYREIAEIITREFGIPRNVHSVQVRNTMLAAYEDAA